ncbi:glycosyltransferase family 2 protein [Aporhodopirellula aestuarii]|uniref:Glycosyltransferase family 2 protein n=1 Tax=Aporhodopirellula aestuarii TaxID=2950107 RepID=A0ABT0TZN3_9BACT|nr:glycosyltransferase family 2 protein [Aporhodopirellula aestuarii]MCM2370069.1 glycosyltransferase family 2 protein [Aporhodopirellula aestuarii]
MSTQTDRSSTEFDAAVLSNRPPHPQSRATTQATPPDEVDLSIVIPAMNEEESLETLHTKVVEVCQRAGKSLEIIFIDDGSSDSTWSKMNSLSRQHAGTRAIRLRRNFGKAAALSAGFSIARGKVVITMDADLQDDPDEIPRFLFALAGQPADQSDSIAETLSPRGQQTTPQSPNSPYQSEGTVTTLDVVSGWKRVRHDPWHKVLPSRVFNALVSGITGVRLHDHNCGFKAYRREVLAEVDLYGERHRFIPVLAAARGWKVGEIEVLHHPRVHGRSKYGLSRLGKGFLDLMSIYLLTDYARRPLHLIGSAGLACFAFGSLGMFYLSARWVVSRIDGGDPLHLHSTAIFYYCILAVLLGAQCVLAGLIAELIVSVSAARDRSLRSFQKGTAAVGNANVPLHHVSFSVSEVAGFDDESSGDTAVRSTGATS